MRGEDSRESNTQTYILGSPPHARGRLRRGRRLAEKRRITPACAGKTSFLPPPFRAGAGSPPHARGRPRRTRDRATRTRITPACAGKTTRAFAECRSLSDHPRMRGEDAPTLRGDTVEEGSPPHARGRHWKGQVNDLHRRITPACAGKTCPGRTPIEFDSDHPRMRGEDLPFSVAAIAKAGSPPHARGRLPIMLLSM